MKLALGISALMKRCIDVKGVAYFTLLFIVFTGLTLFQTQKMQTWELQGSNTGVVEELYIHKHASHHNLRGPMVAIRLDNDELIYARVDPKQNFEKGAALRFGIYEHNKTQEIEYRVSGYVQRN